LVLRFLHILRLRELWPVWFLWATLFFHGSQAGCIGIFRFYDGALFYGCFLFWIAVFLFFYVVLVLWGGFVFVRAFLRCDWFMVSFYILHACALYLWGMKVVLFFASLNLFLLGHGWHAMP